MLLEFACSNHKSIRSEVLFSTLAGKDTAYEEKTYETAGIKVLKAAVIYGANGSGKSNFIDAISFIKNLVTNSIHHQPGQGIRQLPHKLEGFDKESTYRIQLITKGIRYVKAFPRDNEETSRKVGAQTVAELFQRRNAIAHQNDRSHNSAVQNDISKEFVTDYISKIEAIVNSLHEIAEGKG